MDFVHPECVELFDQKAKLKKRYSGSKGESFQTFLGDSMCKTDYVWGLLGRFLGFL